jgi:hypothetical protein
LPETERRLGILPPPGESSKDNAKDLWEAVMKAAPPSVHATSLTIRTKDTSSQADPISLTNGGQRLSRELGKRLAGDAAVVVANPEMSVRWEGIRNRAAVVLKREPDFLICHNGKWGILEVRGATYHTHPVRDHDRARLFQKHGLLCVHFYPAQRCSEEPAKVVDEFLALLGSY